MVKARAAVNLQRPGFSGEHSDLLDELAALIVRLWDEHYTSPIFAGDEMIFTLGGNGYVAVFSHEGFGALLEIRSPHGSVDLRPGDSGVEIAKIESPEGVPADEILRDFLKGIQDYYREGPRLRV
jgi:hypothetical protein